MASRTLATMLLVVTGIAGAVTPAEACAVWCLSGPAAQHSHAAMHCGQKTRVTAGMCDQECLSQPALKTMSLVTSPEVGVHVRGVGAAPVMEVDSAGRIWRESAGPPGPARELPVIRI